MPVTNSRVIHHHPRYYFTDGSAVLYCDGVLYNIHRSLFMRKSEFFRDLFELPQPANSREGLEDDHPITIEGVNRQDLEYLLEYLYDHDGVRSPSISYLVAILRLSTRWLLRVGQSFAIETLPGHVDFTPFLQLQLAREFRIKEWVDPAFRNLINKPLEDINLAQATQMGDMPYYVLSQTKRHIDAHVRNIAFVPPPVHGSFLCSANNDCEEAWNKAWWLGFAKHILHPDSPLSGCEAMHVLNDVRIPGMCDNCLRNTMDDIWEASPFGEIELMICEGIGQIIEWATGEEVKSAYLEVQEVQMEMQTI